MGAHSIPEDSDSESVTADSAADDVESTPKGGRPGPVDEGKNGGMATRELAPDVADHD